MLFISLCYGTQAVISEERRKEASKKKNSASADGIASLAFEDEIILTDEEQ
jgi:hypothetical protein